MIGYNNQQQLTRLCSFQEDFVLLQSPLRNNDNQGQQAIILNKAQSKVIALGQGQYRDNTLSTADSIYVTFLLHCACKKHTATH